MERISIDELPQYSVWVSRLLGLDPFARPVRNMAKIDAEYDKDKYATLLDYYTKNPSSSIKEIRSQNDAGLSVICVSKEGQLFLTSPDNLLQLRNEILVDTLKEPITNATTVLELGCGWGYNLSVLCDAYPDRVWIGGEYSQNAVQLGGALFANRNDTSVLDFNWYDDSWPIFDAFQGKALVFTSHSIEQLPKVDRVLQTFKKYRERISGVVHLEPVYELADKPTTLDMMRKAEIGWEKRTPKSDKIERRRCQYERCPSRKIHEGIPPGSSEAGNGREAIIAGGSPPVVPGAIDVRVLGEGTKGRQTGRCRQDVQALD